MNAKLEAIAEQAAERLKALIKDGEKNILEAWSAAEEEALLNEAKPTFRLGFTIALDLDADKATYTLGFSIRHKLEINSPIPDPNQMELVEKN